MPEPEPMPLECATCGAQLKANQHYCIECGTEVGATETRGLPLEPPGPQLARRTIGTWLGLGVIVTMIAATLMWWLTMGDDRVDVALSGSDTTAVGAGVATGDSTSTLPATTTTAAPDPPSTTVLGEATTSTTATTTAGEPQSPLATAPTILQVSVAPDGSPANQGSVLPAISGDGRYVVFASFADNLVADDTNETADIFVYDTTLRSIERVSMGIGGVEADGASTYPAISDTGRFVTFISAATNLVADDVNGVEDVLIVDRSTGLTELVSVSSSGDQANNPSMFGSSVTPDGRFVAFASRADNLVASDTNGQDDVFLRDRSSATTELVSVATDGTQGLDSWSLEPAVSSDGRYVVFKSVASTLVSDDTNGHWDVFRRDRDAGTTVRLSLTASGTEWGGYSTEPRASSDARYIVYQSDGRGILRLDTEPGALDVVSVRPDGTPTTAFSSCAAVSDDGRFVAFSSRAGDLDAADTGGFSDIFVRDLGAAATRQITMVSESPQDDGVGCPDISHDGRVVVFTAWSDEVLTDDQNGTADIVLVELWDS